MEEQIDNQQQKPQEESGTSAQPPAPAQPPAGTEPGNPAQPPQTPAQPPAQQPAQPPAPAQPVVYDFKALVPEGFEFSQEESDKFVNVIRDMNLTSEQANEIVKYGMGWGQQIANSIVEEFNNTVKQWGEDAKKQLGSDYDKTMAQCGAGIEYLRKVMPNIDEAISMTGAGNRVEFIKLFAMFGEMISSDPGKLGSLTGQPAQPVEQKLYPNTDWSKYV